MVKYRTLDTPAGPFTVVVSNTHAVRAAGFTDDVGELLTLVHPGLRDDAEPADDVGPAAGAVRSYFDGDRAALDAVVVEQHSAGEFMRHAWQVMREIKPGFPVTYTEFARLSGRPAAIRAAAAACARNPVALFTPCHRVLRTDGSLGGYRWGLPVKRLLLDHEQAAG
ncbi:methylated-DNA--[protein]-cysteine S-methyltransferase [Paractinoplanes brasiliensis]|uniref:Methylated-DNA-[protein]-cysteine S-methyltransferase n=1 Tax=Paractinoplanes brasiliensis TaxID=52695 RepID=A0A4R6JVI4_9ACTN|nr:methylated-DNA--[protein]-cysteine S-methyltransferase [Actinoplanes brasiliensis]TDO40257.1 methylated-DNA-[protein]-cysteine S-methyltransferase [Actinoplanes brasiliensis]GID25321.1 putative methylated-DNA:protein-cysteine methyltransferase [Actinoplanes brasiliensis]